MTVLAMDAEDTMSDWRHPVDTSSERVARLLATPPPPAPLRTLRAEVAEALGLAVVVRSWTGEASRG